MFNYVIVNDGRDDLIDTLNKLHRKGFTKLQWSFIPDSASYLIPDSGSYLITYFEENMTP